MTVEQGGVTQAMILMGRIDARHQLFQADVVIQHDDIRIDLPQGVEVRGQGVNAGLALEHIVRQCRIPRTTQPPLGGVPGAGTVEKIQVPAILEEEREGVGTVLAIMSRPVEAVAPPQDDRDAVAVRRNESAHGDLPQQCPHARGVPEDQQYARAGHRPSFRHRRPEQSIPASRFRGTGVGADAGCHPMLRHREGLERNTPCWYEETMPILLSLSGFARAFRRTAYLSGFIVSFALFPAAVQGWLGKDEWYPLTDEEREMTAPKIDPEAGAEILLREYEVNDGDNKLVWNEYVRIKIFNERGVEQLSPIDISAPTAESGMTVSARVIKPDGSIINLDKADVYSREAARVSGRKQVLHSFSLPGLEPGCVIEYKWRQTVWYYYSGDRLDFLSADMPVHVSRFRFRPYERKNVRWLTFMTQGKAMERQKGGFWEIEVRDLAARPTAGFLPPRRSIEPWVYTYYYDRPQTPEETWTEFTKRLEEDHWHKVKPKQRAVRDKAAALTAGATNQMQALERIYRYCTNEIIDVYSPQARLTPKERAEVKDNNDPSETIAKGRGTKDDIAHLFASLAEAAGMKIRLGICNDRSIVRFEPGILPDLAMFDRMVAVEIDGKWTVYNPSYRFVPFGAHHWSNEGTYIVLEGSKKDPEFWRITPSPASHTRAERHGEFTIDEEGTLKGQVKVIVSGHSAYGWRAAFDGDSQSEREDAIKDSVTELQPGAKLSDIKIVNADSWEGNLEIHYSVEVPNYADVTAERLFLPTAYFQKGATPVFKDDKRDYDIDFRYPWETQDIVRINFPDRFVMEEGASPQSLADTPAFVHKAALGKVRGKNRLVFNRLERVNVVEVEQRFYDTVKAHFDAVYNQDQHILTLRRLKEGEEPPEEPPPAQRSTAAGPASGGA